MKDLNIKLEELRKQKKLNRKELSKVIGISEKAIYNYEKNLRTPSNEILKNYSEYFDIPIDFFTNPYITSTSKTAMELENILKIDYSYIDNIQSYPLACSKLLSSKDLILKIDLLQEIKEIKKNVEKCREPWNYIITSENDIVIKYNDTDFIDLKDYNKRLSNLSIYLKSIESNCIQFTNFKNTTITHLDISEYVDLNLLKQLLTVDFSEQPYSYIQLLEKVNTHLVQVSKIIKYEIITDFNNNLDE